MMKVIFALFLFPVTGTLAQTQPGVVGSGYLLPDSVYAAPGQLTTLFVQGLSSYQPIKTAQAPPNANLPTTLGGFSLIYGQAPFSALLPILQIQQVNSCLPNEWPYPCLEIAAVTVQIPFEAMFVPVPVTCTVCQGAAYAIIEIVPSTDPSAVNPEFNVAPVSDWVHVLTKCDPFLSTANAAPLPVGFPCSSIVTHGDGSAVSATSPGKAGEELVAYTVGLGQTNPASVTGQLVTKSAPTVTTFTLDYNYHPNALPSRPLPTGPQPIFAGTTPGYVGLYQVNFVVPPVPAGTPPCVDVSNLPQGSNVVQSNLTVSIGGQFSFDGARICVATN